ncbi:MAG: ATP-dependent zinc metalloprotease FtsH [Deltaproteobacteria bacterium]|jgi:cell division protease FtsH|nr:ATP-dependent zinc metalloprotease FtsH [Deltaproteobacteria bacterium]
MIVLIILGLFNYFKPSEDVTRQSYSQVFDAVTKGEVQEAIISSTELVVVLKDSRTRWAAYLPYDESLLPALREQNVKITVSPPASGHWYTFLGGLFQIILLVAVFLFFMRQMQGGGKAMTFAKSRAKMLSDEQRKVTFADVAGIEEAKGELEEIIDFLREPGKFVKLGGRIPKGVLLMGAPGTGKTLLARAIAGEAGVPFFSISGSDFVEMFVGVGASRVRDMFSQAKKSSPCILFIDEIDAVGRHRGAGLGGGHDEREQTLNQLLVEMDGFEPNEALIVIAATNRPDVLDPALLRPGRFDRQVVVPLPDVLGREQILQVHSKKVPLASNVSLTTVARGTPGFSGADLENLINEAALMAARKNKDEVEGADLEAARDKLMMGVERKSLIMSEEEKKTTAWHEAGHTLVALLLPFADPLHKVSIIPRGRALGVTQYLPTEDKHTFSRDFFKTTLAILMGGRVAEELALNQLTTGASNDIERATKLAHKMVTRYGMSDTLGPLTFGKQEDQIFLGREIAQHRDYSEQTAQRIDNEVKTLVLGGYEKARELVGKHMAVLKALAELLLEKETIDASEAIDVAKDAILSEGLPIPKVGESLDPDAKDTKSHPKTRKPRSPKTAKASKKSEGLFDKAPDSPESAKTRGRKERGEDPEAARDDGEDSPDDDAGETPRNDAGNDANEAANEAPKGGNGRANDDAGDREEEDDDSENKD